MLYIKKKTIINLMQNFVKCELQERWVSGVILVYIAVSKKVFCLFCIFFCEEDRGKFEFSKD